MSLYIKIILHFRIIKTRDSLCNLDDIIKFKIKNGETEFKPYKK